MANLPEDKKWTGVYQWETSDRALGGPDSLFTKPTRDLTARTGYLKEQIEKGNEALTEHEKSTNHPDVTTVAKGFVKLSSAVDSTSETLAATPKAVKTAMDKANSAASAASTAQSTANTAKTNAATAQSKADIAYSLASTANTSASNAVTTANTASSTASNALSVANTAKSTATSAKSIAETDATTTVKGRVQLDSSTTSTAVDKAATPLAVKKACDALKNGGINTIELPLLSDFKSIKIPSGIYRAFGASAPNIATPNAPPASGNATLTVTVRCNGMVSHYEVIENALGNPIKWVGECFTVNSSLAVYWTKVVTSANLDSELKNSKIVVKQGDHGIGGKSIVDSGDGSYPKGCGFVYLPKNAVASPEPSIPLVGLNIISNSDQWGGQILLRDGTTSPRVFVRTIGYGEFKGSAEFITTSNIVNYMPAGIPQPWPTTTIPSGWLKCNGATFDKTLYPKLAIAYPTGKLPDLRGEFIRGFDDGRGIDSGRTILSSQGDAMRNFKGEFENNGHAGKWGEENYPTGPFTIIGSAHSNYQDANVGCRYSFDPSLVVPTADENRPRNIAFLYIVKAE